MSNFRVESAEQAKQNPEYLSALKDLLLQIADDDFIMAFRGSEWLGLAPHIEEDVAFSSISQDMMGHAVLFYEMLEALGAGRADDLAQLRKPEDFRNAVLVERVNGPAFIWKNPAMIGLMPLCVRIFTVCSSKSGLNLCPMLPTFR